jgi:hypothetical protein
VSTRWRRSDSTASPSPGTTDRARPKRRRGLFLWIHSEDEAAELLDAYLVRADTAARLAQVAHDRRERLEIDGFPGSSNPGD